MSEVLSSFPEDNLVEQFQYEVASSLPIPSSNPLDVCYYIQLNSIQNFDKVFYSFLGGARRTARDPDVSSRVGFIFGHPIDIEVEKFQ